MPGVSGTSIWAKAPWLDQDWLQELHIQQNLECLGVPQEELACEGWIILQILLLLEPLDFE